MSDGTYVADRGEVRVTVDRGPAPIEKVTLELTPHMAGMLRSLLGQFYVGGAMAPIYSTLADARVPVVDVEMSIVDARRPLIAVTRAP